MNSYDRHTTNGNGWSDEQMRRGASLTGRPPHTWHEKQQTSWTDKAGWRDVSRSSSLTGSKPIEGFIPSPATIRFILLCCLWYTTSALSSNTGKAIMLIFKYPVTLTIVQFGFIAVYCLLLASPVIGMTKIRYPNKIILQSTIPMAMFQVGGHIFSSIAISRVPVSTVHTVKALSPLFTVAAYVLLFGVKYSAATYISLLPLTVGVMLACTFDVSGSNVLGLTCAFGSALIFVTSNIFFKKIMPTPSGNGAGPAHRLDKINLLFYSSGLAFLFMIPVWLYSDFGAIFNHLSLGSIRSVNAQSHSSGTSLTYYFFMNGTVHFAQNIIAFAILSTTSPVTYSIASLIKRIAVICIAIVWFKQAIHPAQGLGICLTFAGLWMYNQAKGDVERGEKQARRVEAARELMLPVSKSESRLMDGTSTPEMMAIEERPPTYPLRPTHPHHSHVIPPPINVSLAANSYSSKYTISTSPNPHMDAYPSPPKSTLDSPPPEAQDFEPVGHSNAAIRSHQQGLGLSNRRTTVTNDHYHPNHTSNHGTLLAAAH